MRRPPRPARGLVSAAATLTVLVLAASAAAQPPAGSTDRTPLPATLPDQPGDYEIPPRRALRIADADATVVAEKARRGELTASVSTTPVRRWEVGYFDGPEKIAIVILDGVSGEVAQSWTGEQVAWPMARGNEGQFGHVLNAPYVWIPLAAIFFFGLLDFRRPLRIVHLDLLVLLSFGISHIYFNNAEIGISVPLYYPPLLYLLARMLWIGFGRRRASSSAGSARRGAAPRGSELRPSAPLLLLAVACVALIAFRLTINIADSGVIDVGYAGVIGADKISDAEPIYGPESFPSNNPTGDTYGPANYFAYVPFEQIFPWSGSWDSLPAARAAAIFFDLLSVAGLFLLGRRLAGNRLAVTLSFAWLAYPYTAFVLQSNSNDSLLAALLIWGLVLFAQPVARGALLAAAAATKFAPLALAPLYLAGHRGFLGRGDPAGTGGARLRPALLYSAGFVLASALFFAHPAVDPGLVTFWERTIGSQAGRVSPFSIWGQTDLELLHTAVKAAAVGLALAVALVPRDRDIRQIAALAAAVMIAVELTAEHWFYLYIVWFLPMLLVALALPATSEREELSGGPPTPADPARAGG